MADEKRPHKAICNVSIEIYPLNNKGECMGEVVNAELLKQNNITSFIIPIDGKDLEDCIVKTKKKLEEIQNA